MCTCLALALSVGATGAPAQLPPQFGTLALDPNVARQGTALLLDADESLLTSGGRAAESITLALPRGTRVDTAARETLCARDEAEFGCPEESRIGFGRYVVAVRGFADWGGEAALTWAIEANLAEPLRRGDAASVVLTSKLLGIDSVAAFLEPALGTTVPIRETTIGRLVRRSSGAYGVELRLAELPVELDVAGPVTATPSRLELSLTAVRRTRKNFVRRIRVRTLSGYEVRRVKDHRLIGHHLLRAPASCSGSWPSELRVGFPGRVKRTVSRIACQSAAGRAASASRDRG